MRGLTVTTAVTQHSRGLSVTPAVTQNSRDLSVSPAVTQHSRAEVCLCVLLSPSPAHTAHTAGCSGSPLAVPWAQLRWDCSSHSSFPTSSWPGQGRAVLAGPEEVVLLQWPHEQTRSGFVWGHKGMSRFCQDL